MSKGLYYTIPMNHLITLDIDGTTVETGRPIPIEVVDYLTDLVAKGWLLAFITGRSFQLAQQLLHPFKCPYFLAVQNGAILLEMPQARIINKRYLANEIIPQMEALCESEPTDFVIYAGYEHQDLCYYRPHKFETGLLEYLKGRTIICNETWIPVKHFDEQIPLSFASVKCFGSEESAQVIAEKIEQQLKLHIPVIRDPFNSAYYVAQATHPTVNKGAAILDLKQYLDHKGIVIAAGDDYNDLSLFENADISIVMQTAPKEIWQYADIVAPAASENGIIEGLQRAITLSRCS